ncbi:cupin domain-containing protein [Roseateles sp. BYS78W]|uniref:Cupin domain-containing protein n=1 Tax=Pelomonas candidula TaxID=3299025 RepID=A0ABW7H7F9_9BURK
MPFIDPTSAPRFELHGASFTSLAAPSRGATETAVWVTTLPPNSVGVPHRLTREEVFVALEGTATATVDGQAYAMTPGCALVVPAQAELKLDNPHDAPFRTVAVLPVGGQAIVGDKPPFTPPWAQ